MNLIRIFHVFVISPLLLYTSYKGIYKQPIPPIVFWLLGAFGLEALLIHSGIIPIHSSEHH